MKFQERIKHIFVQINNIVILAAFIGIIVATNVAISHNKETDKKVMLWTLSLTTLILGFIFVVGVLVR